MHVEKCKDESITYHFMHHMSVFEAKKIDHKAFQKIPLVKNLATILNSHELRVDKLSKL